MVHLCVSISDDGVRLESVQKGWSNTRNRKKEIIDMATMRTRSRTGSSRQDRGSCSSTASCPVFSGPYSDQEEDPPLRGQSSPLLKGSPSSLQNSASESLKGSVSSLQGSVPYLQGSLPSLGGYLTNFKEPLSSLKGSTSRMKRLSLGSLDNSSTIPSERSISPNLQSHNGSSSDDDNSWDTNSWSSGATCLRRTPVKQDPADESGEKSYNTNQESGITMDEPEIIYQNLIIARAENKSDSKGGVKTTFVPLRKDEETQSLTLCSLGKNPTSVATQHWDKNTHDRRKFSQFLNEVSFRVLKTNNGSPQQLTSLRHRYPSPPPPPSTPSHPSLTKVLHSPHSHLPPAPSATNLWYSPTNSNLQPIKECVSKEIKSSIHHWSKTLPSCKILEPGDVLQKVKGESLAHPEHDLELCTKLQAQSCTGRLYLETDIDRVRQLDELVSNGSLGKERIKKGLEKSMEREKERGNRREPLWERDRGADKGKKAEKGTEKLCWDKDKRRERGRENEKKVVLIGYEHSAPPLPPPPQTILSGRTKPCPTFSWSEEFPRMSYRSTSLPRPINMTVSTTVITCS